MLRTLRKYPLQILTLFLLLVLVTLFILSIFIKKNRVDKEYELKKDGLQMRSVWAIIENDYVFVNMFSMMKK